MNRSLNEIEAHAKRAARGAGLSWGMAEETGRAARWLSSHDLAGPALLADVLEKNDGLAHAQVAPVSLDGDWYAQAGELCPLAVGATLNDCAERLGPGLSIKARNVSCPLLIVPFAAWAAIHLRQPVRVTYEDVRIETDGDGLWIDDPNQAINAGKAETVIVQRASTRTDPAQRPAVRGNVSCENWARLGIFSERTFAPATEASRRLGAGSGLSDND